VEEVVEATVRPKPVHGVCDVRPPEAKALHSRFWARLGEEGDAEEASDVDVLTPGFVDEGNSDINISMPEIVEGATAAGFTVDDLLRAEEALGSGKP
jgi:hypothetical protein